MNKEGVNAYDEPQDKLVYISKYLFFVSQQARWNYLVTWSKLPTIGEDIDIAMILI